MWPSNSQRIPGHAFQGVGYETRRGVCHKEHEQGKYPAIFDGARSRESSSQGLSIYTYVECEQRESGVITSQTLNKYEEA